MPEKGRKFHEFALKSILFKGRHDWYFCYLKTERIAHVLAVLSERNTVPHLKDMVEHARTLPADIARLAAGEFDVAVALAEVFALLTELRLAATRGYLLSDNAALLVREYEAVAERLMTGSHPSPFGTAEDLFIPEVIQEPVSLRPRLAEVSPASPVHIKDMSHKGQSKGHNTRVSLILEYIRKQKSASIKDIAAIVPGCSEKTVQRELNDLIAQGLVRRVGERRWSVYTLAAE